jgi:cysteine synthase
MHSAECVARAKADIEGYGAELATGPTEGSMGRSGAAGIFMGTIRKIYPDQYNNDANCLAHYNTTAVEILQQSDYKIAISWQGWYGRHVRVRQACVREAG